MTRVSLLFAFIAVLLFTDTLGQNTVERGLFPGPSFDPKKTCEQMHLAAQHDLISCNARYAVYMQFFVTKANVAQAIILRDQFHIKSVLQTVSCLEGVIDNTQCYNKVVDIVMSLHLKQDFPKLLQQKADSLLKKMSAKELEREYPNLM